MSGFGLVEGLFNSLTNKDNKQTKDKYHNTIKNNITTYEITSYNQAHFGHTFTNVTSRLWAATNDYFHCQSICRLL